MRHAPLAGLSALLILATPPLASATLLPGAGSARTECYVQLDIDSFGPPETRQRAFCVDGDPSCDHDGLCNGACTFRARLCVNDLGIRQCTPPPTLKRLTVRQNLLPLPDSLSTADCGEFADVTVPVRGPVIRPRPGKVVLHVTAAAARAADRDRFVLVCGPRFDDCPPQPTTTTAPATTTTSTTVLSTTSTTGTSTSTTSTSSTTGSSSSTTSTSTSLVSTTTTTSTTTSTTSSATSSSTTSTTSTTTSTTSSTTSEPTTTTSSTSTTEAPTTTTSTSEESTTTTSSTSTSEGPTTTTSLPPSPGAAFVA